MKDAGSAKVLEVIRLLLSGSSYVSPQVSARLLDAVTGRRPRGSTSPIEKLSDREFEVFRLLGSGKSTKEVARVLNLSPKTVETHRSHIKDKLDLKNSREVARFALQWLNTRNA